MPTEVELRDILEAMSKSDKKNPAVSKLLDKLNQKGGPGDVTIKRAETKEIVVPIGMSLKNAASWCLRKDEEENREVGVLVEFECFPLDGAVAFRLALEQIYGFVSNVETPSFFGNKPPLMVSVPISADETVQVPWGRVEIPGIEGYLTTQIDSRSVPKFVIGGTVKQRHMPEIERIAQLTRQNLRERSIYKGKAFRIDLAWMREGEEFNPTHHAPKFTIPVDKINENELIFPAAVKRDIELGLFTPIQFAAQCRKNKIPLKRGILLAGHYGTGKTLTAYVTAKKAVNNGFTFIYVNSPLDLAEAFKVACQYAPVVIFAEDVDQVIGMERTETANEILNTFDGVESKAAEIITVLTTNHIEKISPALLRPGRCDTLVHVTRPDAQAAVELVKLYGRGLLSADSNFDNIGVALADHLPAEIREAVERAKLAAIYRLGDDGSIEGKVTDKDILDAVHAMNSQHELLKPAEQDARSPIEKCADIIGQRLAEGVANADKGTAIAHNLLQELGHTAQAQKRVARTLSVNNDKRV